MLQKITISGFRNISSAVFHPSKSFNLFVGPNGSGKTSILEAIYHFSLGRSFRTHLTSRVIQHELDAFTLFAQMYDGNMLGITKHQDSSSIYKLNGKSCQSIAELTSLLPVQLINPHSYSLLEGGPSNRRSFLDWGVFHVKPHFFELWKRYRKALKNRNSALKQGMPDKEIRLWDHLLVESAQAIHELREEQLSLFMNAFRPLLKEILGLDIDISLYPGWSRELPFSDMLSRQYARDKALGYTQSGAHRADLRITSQKLPVVDVLSRGQQKLLIFALKLSQGRMLDSLCHKECIYLVDDFNAELDAENQQIFLRELQKINAQVFLATTSQDYATLVADIPETSVFHVKHGSLTLNENDLILVESP